MPVEYSGLIGLGLFFALVIWLWWYALHGKSAGSDKSKDKPKKKIEIYPGHGDLL